MSRPDQPPVILQVLPALGGGGVERGTVEMVAAIAAAGWTPLVASAGGRLAPAVEHAGGRHVTLPLDTKQPWRIWRNAGRLAALVREAGVDLIHARSRAPAWSAWLAAGRTGTPFVTTYHAPYGEDLPGKRWYNGVMARGERVIAISRHIAALVAERHGVPPERLRVIHRGVDPRAFDPAGVSADRMMRLLAAWRLPVDQDIVLLPGRLTRWKGQGVLIEALARMSRTDLACVLVGDDQGRGRYAAELVTLAERLGVGERVRLVGHCEDMPAALALATVVVNASVAPEGFGRVIVEAQAMGRLVVATDHGGAAETIETGVSGWLVPPGDAAALAAVLDALLLLTPLERASFGARARAMVRARFTTRAMQDATMAVYREVLADAGRDRRVT
jgi:glycosyltransferase involved in cell wall biosynthesis